MADAPKIIGLPDLPDPKKKLKGARGWLPVFQNFIDQLRVQSKEVAADDDRGSKLRLWGSQRIFLEQVSAGMDENIRDFYCLKSRQLGITTVSLAIDLFWLAVHPRMLGVLVSDNDNNAAFFRKTLQNYYKSLPPEFTGSEFQKIKDNSDYMEFSNGSRLDFLVAGSRKKTWGEGRGYTLCHSTETSKYGTPEGIVSFQETLAETHPDRLFLWESTANGYNHWKDMYEAADDDPYTKKAMFIGWWSKEINSIGRKDQRFAIYGYPPTEVEREKWRSCGNVMASKSVWNNWRGDAREMRTAAKANKTMIKTSRGMRKKRLSKVGTVSSKTDCYRNAMTKSPIQIIR